MFYVSVTYYMNCNGRIIIGCVLVHVTPKCLYANKSEADLRMQWSNVNSTLICLTRYSYV